MRFLKTNFLKENLFFGKSIKDILFCSKLINQAYEIRLSFFPIFDDSRNRVKKLFNNNFKKKEFIPYELNLENQKYKKFTFRSRMARIKLQKKIAQDY